MQNTIIPSNKSFGITFFIFFAVLAVIFIDSEKLLFLFTTGSLFFLVFGLLNSKILSPLNIVWSKFGRLISNIMNPIVMLLIYLIAVCPAKLFILLTNRDILSIKFDCKTNKANSYWKKRKQKINSMDRQF